MFRWKSKQPDVEKRNLEGSFRCTVDLSINGLMRKYAIYSNGSTFAEFVSAAIKQAFINQIHRRLTSENYEALDLDEGAERSKIDLFSTTAITPEWNNINSANFSLLSYPTSIWLKNLFDRARNSDEKAFIQKFQ